jgi:hypothetical protein
MVGEPHDQPITEVQHLGRATPSTQKDLGMVAHICNPS